MISNDNTRALPKLVNLCQLGPVCKHNIFLYTQIKFPKHFWSFNNIPKMGLEFLRMFDQTVGPTRSAELIEHVKKNCETRSNYEMVKHS